MGNDKGGIHRIRSAYAHRCWIIWNRGTFVIFTFEVEFVYQFPIKQIDRARNLYAPDFKLLFNKYRVDTV
jgi:hypothetical protein